MALFVKRSRRHSSQTIYTEKRYYIVVTARHYISGGYTPSRVLKGRLFRSHKGSLHSEDAPTQWFTVFWWSTYCQKIGKRACPFLHAKSSIMDSIRSSLSEREREGSACFDPWPRNDINHVAEAIGVKSSVSISCRHFLLSFLLFFYPPCQQRVKSMRRRRGQLLPCFVPFWYRIGKRRIPRTMERRGRWAGRQGKEKGHHRPVERCALSPLTITLGHTRIEAEKKRRESLPFLKPYVTPCIS